MRWPGHRYQLAKASLVKRKREKENIVGAKERKKGKGAAGREDGGSEEKKRQRKVCGKAKRAKSRWEIRLSVVANHDPFPQGKSASCPSKVQSSPCFALNAFFSFIHPFQRRCQWAGTLFPDCHDNRLLCNCTEHPSKPSHQWGVARFRNSAWCDPRSHQVGPIIRFRTLTVPGTGHPMTIVCVRYGTNNTPTQVTLGPPVSRSPGRTWWRHILLVRFPRLLDMLQFGAL